MEKRRIAFDIGVTYNTPVKKLKLIPGIAKKAITSTKNCSFDRTHFNKFGDFSMNFEVVYYVNTSDYNEYMDAQQEINLKITEEFEKQKIEFAYPTQTVYVKK
ncbi:mechanosensitive ion channel [Candidatus Micrarchaeota archaeon]|nr:mechanosensitive ion channel [Candidatus Micrarchaeota archaeon]